MKLDRIGVRPLEYTDIPAALDLFIRVFREPGARFASNVNYYLRDLLFGSPSYSKATGSFVYEEKDGSIGSAILAVPMEFVANGRVVPARLLCAYMADTLHNKAGASALALATRAKTQDFAFSDSASPTSYAHVCALGGIALPIHNLEWVRVFQPLGAFIERIERRLFGRHSLGLVSLAKPVDAVIRFAHKRIAPISTQNSTVLSMSIDSFLTEAPRLIEHYAVRPRWSRDELAWIVYMASRNTWYGPLQICCVRDKNQNIIGSFVYFGRNGRSAYILNILAQQGSEVEVCAAMFGYLDHCSFTLAQGRALPALLVGLANQSMLSLRHKAFVCLMTKHQDILEAAKYGNIYLGGLAGESWSRLMTDL